MECKKCKCTEVVKNGKQSNGKQRYYCKSCKVSFQTNYSYNAYQNSINKKTYELLKEGVGINSTARLLKVSKVTVIKRIKYLASLINRPLFNERGQYYEIDEMKVVVGYTDDEIWLTYAMNRNTKQIVNFIVDRKTKVNLSVVTQSVLKLNPKYVYTDGLVSYRTLIPKNIHNTAKKNTTIIERNNLTLRTHLKRLTRKTICYSKKSEMLEASLKLYFWGYQLSLLNNT